MTLLYLDGFAHGQIARYIANGNNGISPPGGFAQSASPRIAGGYYATANASADIRRAITAAGEVFTGAGLYPSALSVGLMSVWSDSGTTQHLTLMVNGSGLLELRRGSTAGTLLATGTTVISALAWRYFELRATVADSGGICQVRLDGSATLEIDFTGDTRNGGTSTNIDAIGLRSSGGSGRFSDWYICDAAGSAPTNTWLGDVQVRTLAPAGNGASSQLTGSDGNSTDNYLLVDELPPSSSDYVGSSAAGLKDTYPVTDLPGTATSVLGVQVAGLMAKSDAGSASAKVVTRVAGTDYAPDTTTLGTSYAEALKLWTSSPATSAAWTTSEVNGLEVGMEVA